MDALLIDVLRAPGRMRGLDLAGWDLLLRQALAANLTASLACLARAEGLLEQVPAAPRRHLDWAATLLARHADAVLWEVACIRSALAGIDAPLLLLKGAAYTAAALPPAQGRLFSDVDILVPRALLPQVEAELMLGGWSLQPHDDYDQRYYRQWMHEIPPMQHAQRGSVIDVHHAILPQTARARPDPDALRAAARAVPGLAGVQVLGPADMVLHSATHLFWDGEFDKGLRDLLDLHLLLGHFAAEPDFWQSLPARARRLQLERPLFYALRYAGMLLGTKVPPAVLTDADAGRPGPVLLALMDALFLRALQPPHSSCADRFSSLARFLLYVRGNWLRMPPLMLARHLFHKAFLAPRKGAASAPPAP